MIQLHPKTSKIKAKNLLFQSAELSIDFENSRQFTPNGFPPLVRTAAPDYALNQRIIVSDCARRFEVVKSFRTVGKRRATKTVSVPRGGEMRLFISAPIRG